MKIKTAVFPVAGLGSRFLPATKSNPKEMLPIVDKPLIQYAVEEAVRAGITHMIFITSSSKRAIEDHFDYNFELEARLQVQGKERLRAIIKDISPPDIKFTYVHQYQPLGLGHAILCAEHVVNDEPFAVLLADDLIDDSNARCLTGMVDIFHNNGNSILAVQPVPWQMVHQYGVVNIDNSLDNCSVILSIVEKPRRELTSSNLASVGRYIFTPTIFTCLKKTNADQNDELQLTDGIQHLLAQEQVQAYQFYGKRYDCGSKLGYLKAIIAYAKQHVEIGDAFCEYLKNEILSSDFVLDS